jgi:hypothetical protein
MHFKNGAIPARKHYNQILISFIVSGCLEQGVDALVLLPILIGRMIN